MGPLPIGEIITADEVIKQIICLFEWVLFPLVKISIQVRQDLIKPLHHVRERKQQPLRLFVNIKTSPKRNQRTCFA
ncbi:MAG: hypothetical protein DI528_15980 [Shinella sp.]|nr:MAG: hypothetical protein DI528_15980 [Shinella sp.]